MRIISLSLQPNLELKAKFGRMFYKRLSTNKLIELSKHFPIVSVIGARQSGKTTLCRTTFSDYDYVNLEDEESRTIMEQDIKGYLRAHPHGLIIDEAHHLPELFSALQVVSDEDDNRRYIISGSSNWLIMHKISQSLAGRVAFLRLLPLSLKELGGEVTTDTDSLICKGFYPAIWGKNRPYRYVYDGYFSTYIQRDVRQIVNIRDLTAFRKFVRLCATRIGCEFVASNIASEIGISVKTAQGWLSVLESSYVLFQMQPYYRNIGKRLTKTPKIYFYDTGLACHLLGIRNPNDVANSPLRGALFENLVIVDQLKNRFNDGLENNFYFYRDKSQREIDLIQEDGLKLKAYEIKSSSVIHKEFFRNLDYLRSLIGDDVELTQVIYDGEQEWKKAENGFVNFRNL